MAITTANLQCNLDSTNAASNTGSGNTWFDLSANNLDFTGTGTSRVSFNGVQVFDLGTGKYFTGLNNFSSVVDWDADWTVELWINVGGSQLGSFHSEWGTGYSYPTNTGFDVQTYNPSPQTRSYFGYGSGTYEVTTYPAATLAIPRSDSIMHQFVVRKSGTTIQYLLDGVPSYSKTGISNAISLSSDPFYIGYGGFYDPMVGKVAVLRVYDAALTNGEVTGNYDSTVFLLNPPVAAKLELNASVSASYPGSGSTWFDLSANNFDFTMYNPAFTAATSTSPAYFTFPARNFGDPLTVYGEYNGTPAITTESSWSGYMWVRRAGNHKSFTQNRLSIFANGREDLVGGDNGWSYGTYNNPNAANDNVIIEAAGFGVYDSGYTLGNDCWVNLAYIKSGSTVSFYENGVAIGSASVSYTTPADGMWISRTAGSYFSWIGDISIIRQFDVALTGPELLYLIQYDQATYNLGIPEVIASWDASDSASYPGTGNTWFDLSGNNVDLLGASSFTYTAKNTTPNPLGWTNPGYFSTPTANRMISTLSNYLRFSTTGTIQGWFYNNNAYGVPLSFPFSGNFPSYWFQAYADKPGVNFLVDSTFRNFNPGGSIINTTWFNWAIVFENGKADLYINGTYLSSNDQSAFGDGIYYNPAQLQLVIGDIDNTGASFPFIGRYGEIKMYSTALSAGDILTNYNDTLYKYDGNAAPPGPGPSPYVGLVGGRTFGQGFAG